MQKENLFFFVFPSARNFGEAKVTKKAVRATDFGELTQKARK